MPYLDHHLSRRSINHIINQLINKQLSNIAIFGSSFKQRLNQSHNQSINQSIKQDINVKNIEWENVIKYGKSDKWPNLKNLSGGLNLIGST